jgi:hypothetical protein
MYGKIKNKYERNVMSKTIDIKSLLIGFLLATSVMLFMGATSNNQNSRYQAFCNSYSSHVYMIDTKTGEFFQYIQRNKTGNRWEKDSRDTNWIVR